MDPRRIGVSFMDELFPTRCMMMLKRQGYRQITVISSKH